MTEEQKRIWEMIKYLRKYGKDSTLYFMGAEKITLKEHAPRIEKVEAEICPGI